MGQDVLSNGLGVSAGSLAFNRVSMGLLRIVAVGWAAAGDLSINRAAVALQLLGNRFLGLPGT